MGDFLGQGSFGRVVKAVQKSTGLVGAVKILKDNDASEFMREVSLCAGLHHPNIVQLVDAIVRPKKGLAFVFAGQNLHVALLADLVPREELRALATQLFDGLAFFTRPFRDAHRRQTQKFVLGQRPEALDYP